MEAMSSTWLDDPDWLAPPRLRIGFDDGSFVLRSPEPLRPMRCIGEWLGAGRRDAGCAGLRRARARWRLASLELGADGAAVGRIAQTCST